MQKLAKNADLSNAKNSKKDEFGVWYIDHEGKAIKPYGRILIKKKGR